MSSSSWPTSVPCLGARTRSARPSRRLELFTTQWESRRMEQHRQRVERAAHVVDVRVPNSATYSHVQTNLKKHERECSRHREVTTHNLILLRHLAEIAISKRVDDGMRVRISRGQGNSQQQHYQQQQPVLHANDVVALRKNQIERIRERMAEIDSQSGERHDEAEKKKPK